MSKKMNSQKTNFSRTPFENEVVLITGGTGSLGKTLVKRLLSGKNGTPKKIIVFSRDEAKQHFMRVEYLKNKVATDEVIYSNFKRMVEFIIGDVRNQESLTRAVRDATVVINAAALKQVPSCEYFVEEAVKTNILGPCNLVRAIRGTQVHSVIGVSTDKACKPINAMGMTKGIQEKVFISSNIDYENVNFCCVRYGNVLASRGSVIPLFHDQIKKGGPVTITSEEMTRFLLPLERAVDTIVAAAQEGKRGDIFVPIVASARVIDVARCLIGDKYIHIKNIGIRPGEKMHEILVSEEEVYRSLRLKFEGCEDEYYVISSALPELTSGIDARQSGQSRRKGFWAPLASTHEYDLKGEYSSQSFLMSPKEVHQMMEKNGLLCADNAKEEMLK